MHEKVKHLHLQKSQRQNKLPLPLLGLLFYILFNANLNFKYSFKNVPTIAMFTLTDLKICPKVGRRQVGVVTLPVGHRERKG